MQPHPERQATCGRLAPLLERQATRVGRLALLAALAGSLLLAASGPAAAAELPAPTAASCPSTFAYPGDAAPRGSIAGWMAFSAAAVGLPRELPVMAALVESNLQNLSDTGSGYAGYFQISRKLHDSGDYAGFPTQPELQIKWFVDHAVAVRRQRLSAGRPDPLGDEAAWGEWIADTERPAAQYRYRYQLRLAEARSLIGTGCGTTGVPPAGAAASLALWGGTEQRLRRKVRVALVCAGSCDATATGTLRIPGSGRRYALEPATGSSEAAGTKLKLALAVPKAAKRAGRRALRRGEAVKVRIDVAATDPAGGESTGRRTIRLD